jgi:hypothetical protein
MKRIHEKLATIGCGITDLPEQIQERIQSIEKLKVQIDEAQKEYDENPTEEVKAKLDDVSEYYEDYVEETCEIIEDWNNWLISKKEEAEAEAKAKAKADAERQQQPPAPAKTEEVAPKKKGIGLGGIILGVAVLAITMGAVNVMKDK